MLKRKELNCSFKCKLLKDAPGAPGQPEVLDSHVNFIRLAWKKPESDGGNPIVGYLVESREEGSSEWTPCNSYPTKMTEYTASNVVEGVSYEFRVRAVNEAGPGAPSKASAPRKAEPPISKINRYVFSFEN